MQSPSSAITGTPSPSPSSVLSTFNSDKFKFWSFVSMALLVFVHAYNIDIRYMSPWTTPNEPLTLTTFTQYFVANGLLRFRIPMLFVISGFLYALHDSKPYGERVKKRFHSLIVPYLLWSGLYLVLFCLVELIPAGAAAIAESHVADMGSEGALVHTYSWWAFPARWIMAPLPYQLWFIRVLFFYNLAYPLLRRWLEGRISRNVFLGIVVVLWILNANLFLIEAEGLLFFSLGIWLQKSGFDIDRPKPWLSPLLWGGVCVGVAAFKTWLAFRGQAFLGNGVFFTLMVLHKVTIASGLIAAWFGFDWVVRWCMARSWFIWLSGFSFMIYVLHAPLVAVAIDPFFALLGYTEGYRMLSFVLLPLALIVFSVLVGAVLRKVLPGVYSVLTGGRGLGEPSAKNPFATPAG